MWSTVGESGNTRPGLDRQETTPAWWFQDMPRALTKEHQVTKATSVRPRFPSPSPAYVLGDRSSGMGGDLCSAGFSWAGRGVVPSSMAQASSGLRGECVEMPPGGPPHPETSPPQVRVSAVSGEPPGDAEVPGSQSALWRFGDWEGRGRAHRLCLPGCPGPSGDGVDAVVFRRSGSQT